MQDFDRKWNEPVVGGEGEEPIGQNPVVSETDPRYLRNVIVKALLTMVILSVTGFLGGRLSSCWLSSLCPLCLWQDQVQETKLGCTFQKIYATRSDDRKQTLLGQVLALQMSKMAAPTSQHQKALGHNIYRKIERQTYSLISWRNCIYYSTWMMMRMFEIFLITHCLLFNIGDGAVKSCRPP